ncbi:MAG TPA: N4-gp56 family major capsid protein [Geobacter sp.]|nr:N4-gp56 family major capsid protein [Geobacter sp.]
MNATNFAGLTSEEKTYWMADIWSYMRSESFVSKLMGDNTNAAIQHIKKLTKTEKGTRAIMQLVAELRKRGVANDNEREGREEALQNYDIDINMGLISHQVKNKGKLSDQQSVINFRETGRDRLKYWLADAVDIMAFLVLSGISLDYNLDGSTYSTEEDEDNPWNQLSFAADVTAPSAGRHFYFDGTDLQAGNTASITSACVPKYGALVDIKAYAKTSHMKPIRMGGKEYYLWVTDPRNLAALKRDTDFLAAITQAGARGSESNPFFTGAITTVDGIVIMEHEKCFNTKGAASGSKWGGGGLVNGTRSLFLGAQALGMVDVGAPDWVEKEFQYGSVQGISTDKFIGFRKPRFDNQYTKNADEDFGVIALDFYIK